MFVLHNIHFLNNNFDFVPSIDIYDISYNVSNIKVVYYDNLFIVSVPPNHPLFNLISENSIKNLNFYDIYSQQQQFIKQLSLYLPYYQLYININKIISTFYIPHKNFIIDNLSNNNINIIHSDVSNNIITHFISCSNSSFLNFVSFYHSYINNLYSLTSISTPNKPGFLNFSDLPFDFTVKRFFTINNISDLSNNKRGIHFNSNFDEILIVNNGNINLELINKNNTKIYFHLLKNNFIFISRNLWITYTINSLDTDITVLCNQPFHNSISDYSFDHFLSHNSS
jgi:hypothetical protein